MGGKFFAAAGAMALAVAAGAGAVQAGPLSDRLSFSGQAAFSVVPETGTYALSGDVDAGLELLPGLAFTLGLYGAATDLSGDVDTPHETYGGISWSTGDYRLSFGFPRPAYDGFAASALDRLDPVAALDPVRLSATRSRVTSGAIYRGELPLGLTVAADAAGGPRWALSLHRMDDITLANFGTEILPAGDPALRVELAGEIGSDGNSGGKALVEREFGALRLGGGVYFAPEPDVADLAEARLGWSATPDLELDLLVQAPRDGKTTTVLGVEKLVGSSGFLKGAVTHQGGQTSSMLAIGLTFGR